MPLHGMCLAGVTEMFLKAIGDRMYVDVPCLLWGMTKISFLSMDFMYHPRLLKCVSCAYPKKHCVTIPNFELCITR